VGGGEGVGELRHGKRKLAVGLSRAYGGQKRGLRGEVPAAALMAATGGAQAGEGERERAGELQWEAGIPFPGSVGAGRG